MRPVWLGLLIYLLFSSCSAEAADPARRTPEDRALAYLSREVPRWSARNKCYSCHNNGDAARALYTAIRLGRAVPPRALADTTRWLTRPGKWDHNGGDGKFNERKLARLQFAAALAEAIAARQVKDRKPLAQAAELVARDQRPDGSWQADAGDDVGSPASYGPILATGTARRLLQQVDPKRYRTAIARADRWLRKVPVANVLDAASVLLSLEGSRDAEAAVRRKKCLTLIRKGQSKDGGWGPYVASSSEAFDTALVMLALLPLAKQPDVKTMLKRGRAYLVSAQKADGSWEETTRPAGETSYAQRISTAGWATQALLLTRKIP